MPKLRRFDLLRADKPLGAGAGLGRALVGRFEADGMTPVGLGCTRPNHYAGDFHRINLTDVGAAFELLADLIAEHGPPKIVVHHTAELVIAPFTETTLDDYRRTWTAMVETLVILGQSVLQPMGRAGGGTLIVSGATASLCRGAWFSAFASARFALRGLTQSLAREYQPAAVHMAHVALDGTIDTPRSSDMHSLDPAKMMIPADIAKAYRQLAHQPESSWTYVLNLRPASESF